MSRINDLDGHLDHYNCVRELPDGRVIGVHMLLFHWTLHVDIDESGYSDRYCYATYPDACRDFVAWDGVGHPPGRWHKHPKSGTRRNPDTGETWHESEDHLRIRTVPHRGAPADPGGQNVSSPSPAPSSPAYREAEVLLYVAAPARL